MKTFLFWGLGLSCLIAVSLGCAYTIDLLGYNGWFIKPKTKQCPVPSSPEPAPSIEKLIQKTSKANHISPLIAKAIIKIESNKLRTDRIRHESHLLNKFKKEKWMNPIEHQALSSSWGLMQIIYGYHKDACELDSYSDLLDPETNIKCGLTVLQGCLKANQEGNTTELNKLRKALICYNGKGEKAKQYADKVLDTLLEVSVESMFKGEPIIEIPNKESKNETPKTTN